MIPRSMPSLSSGDDDEANMDIELPEENGAYAPLNFNLDRSDEYEPSTDDVLDDS